ncbi:ABC transporter permease [Glaciibacter superstes]|uniref:ABC transporter permease n=1 Tax=Glaciibacter superstes TaxID=501023 RepID=UPI0004104460|nr:ABC transporter permease [Glaciibacter superstes]
MTALIALTRSEATLLSRNPTAIFMALLFPAALLLMQGLVIPGTDALIGGDDPIFARLRTIDLFVPIALTVALGSVSLTNFPSAIGGYREKGVLRRLATTPVGPHRVLFAQVIISGLSLVAGAVIAVLAAMVLLHAQAPQSALLVTGIFVLAAIQMLAVGSLIAARASSAQNANGIGMLVFFASLFTAGVWTPGPMMPEPLQQISGFTPLGAASQALTAGWYGQPVPLVPIVAMSLWTIVLILLAVRTFRWC